MRVEDGRGPTRTGDPLGVNEVLWPTELRAPGRGTSRLAERADLGANAECEAGRVGREGQAGGESRSGLAGGDRGGAGAGAAAAAGDRGEQVVRARVEKYGTVKSVNVKAWPAVELLWGKADSVKVRAGSLKLSPAQTVELLGEAHGVTKHER